MVAWRVFAASLVALPLVGCYYLKQYRGQLAILFASRPIEEVVSQGKVTAQEAETLHYILDLKRFAEERIGLKKTENFTTYFDAGNRPVSWAVSACRKDRFEPYLWHYPIVGPSRYKGFFDEEDARSEQQRLENLGYDTVLSPVPAYSTLGYFRDPVYSHFLNYSRADLADLIIHELVHSTVYVAGNTAYNESLASFVASIAAEEFLIERFGEESDPVREFRSDRRDNGITEAFMSGVFGLLDAYYRAGLAERREEAFELIRNEYAQVHRLWSRPQLGLLARSGVNNATVMVNRTYYRTAWWSRVHERCRGDWKAFFDLARRAGAGKDPFREMEKLLSHEGPLD